MYNNISPHLFVLSTFLISIFSFLIFREIGTHEKYFFVPVFGLAVVYGLINFIRQRKGGSHFSVQKKIEFYPLVKKSIARYLVWLVILYAGFKFYELHPIYKQVEKNLVFFSYFFELYLMFGLPYFFVTLIFKSSSKEDFYDPAIRIIHIFKQISLRILKWNKSYPSLLRSYGIAKGSRPVFGVLKKQYNKKVLLNLLMRGYFIPFMVIQVYTNINDSIRFSEGNFRGYDLLTVLMWTSAILWLTDTLNASMSYCIESRWIENRSRSIDMTVGGWLVCLACYAPLNNITGSLFPFGPFAASKYPDLIFVQDITFIYFIKILEITVLIFHVYADCSLGPSIANITFKKLQTRGLYGIIRHPGTTFKLMLWWVQAMFYREFWRFDFLFGHLMWNLLYILRAITEERHLGKFEEYREYMKKVKYRFIPWVV